MGGNKWSGRVLGGGVGWVYHAPIKPQPCLLIKSISLNTFIFYAIKEWECCITKINFKLKKIKIFQIKNQRANIIFDHKQQNIPHFGFCVEKFNLILRLLTCLLFGP